MVGKLIVIDGTDGSGKATQTELLLERLRRDGYRVECADFPQYGKRSAAMVEDYLNGKFGTVKEVGPYRASIFYAIDRFAASFQIRQWLEEGKIVISNRYVSANMGHQAGTILDSKERDQYLEWLHHLEFEIFKIPRPDATILLYMPPAIGQTLVDKKGNREYVHGNKRDILESDLEHLNNAAQAYLYCAKKFNWPIVHCAPANKLLSKEQIHEELYKKLKEFLEMPSASKPA